MNDPYQSKNHKANNLVGLLMDFKDSAFYKINL